MRKEGTKITKQKSLIEIRTGSDSDIPRIKKAYDFLEDIDISYSPRILSAHRTPDRMAKEARNLSKDGFMVSIAAAGGSAHLPGMSASETMVPVVGLPVKTSSFEGWDSLFSIIQMPNGVPVGTVGIGQAESAAILAVQIAYNNNIDVRNKIRKYRGIEGELSNDLKTVPLVGVIKPKEIEVDEAKCGGMISLMKKLGLKVKEFDVDLDEARSVLSDIEDEGAMAIIAIGDLERADFSKLIAGYTDLATIGLIVREGKVREEIFDSFLYYTDEEGGPVLGMGIKRYRNAALYAAQIAGMFVSEIRKKVGAFRSELALSVEDKDLQVKSEGVKTFIN